MGLERHLPEMCGLKFSGNGSILYSKWHEGRTAIIFVFQQFHVNMDALSSQGNFKCKS